MDTSSVTNVGADLVKKLVSGGIAVVGIIILAGIILGLGFYIRYLRQFNVIVRIKSIRGRGVKGEPIFKLISDAGGTVEDKKDKTIWFRLRGMKVDLPPAPLECFQLDSKGRNHIDIMQTSDTDFHYLLPDSVEMNTIIVNGKESPVAEFKMKVVGGDVAYWNQLRKKQDKKMFDAESMLMKLLPYIIPVLMFMLVIFMTYLITSHWGEFSTAAQYLKEAAEALRGTTTAQVTTG